MTDHENHRSVIRATFCEWRSTNTSVSVCTGYSGGVLSSTTTDYAGEGQLDAQVREIAEKNAPLILVDYRVAAKEPVPGTDRYPRNPLSRPWKVEASTLATLRRLLPTWLSERGGAVIYVNGVMDSSHFGDLSVMPARFLAEENNNLNDAPMERGDLAALLQSAVDFMVPGSNIDDFFVELPPEQPLRRNRHKKAR